MICGDIEESPFCEQKAAKNFVNEETPMPGRRPPSEQKFFVSFFQKRCFFVRFNLLISLNAFRAGAKAPSLRTATIEFRPFRT